LFVRYNVGDVVKMRKPHPCGGEDWEIMRTGVDFRIKCTTCGRVILVPRPKFEKSVKKIIEKADT
jgi:hypothetical protein